MLNIEKALWESMGLFYFMTMSKQTEKRNKLERWLDKHNHTMEMLRTLIAVLVLILQIYILINIIK